MLNEYDFRDAVNDALRSLVRIAKQSKIRKYA